MQTFFANFGILFEEVTKQDWRLRTPTQLFAHNTQQKDTQQLDPYSFKLGTGVLGRIADALSSKGFKTGSYSLTGKTYALVGEPEKSPGVNFVDKNGFVQFNEKPTSQDMSKTMAKVNNPTTSTSGLFAKKWSEIFDESLRQTNDLYEALGDVSLSTSFPNSQLGKSLKQVASIMMKKDDLGQDKQFFHVETGGWDTHSNQNELLGNLNRDLNACITAFTKEMKEQGNWDNVVFVLASEFGWTLSACQNYW